jgi:hypothetical protein
LPLLTTRVEVVSWSVALLVAICIEPMQVTTPCLVVHVPVAAAAGVAVMFGRTPMNSAAVAGTTQRAAKLLANRFLVLGVTVAAMLVTPFMGD